MSANKEHWVTRLKGIVAASPYRLGCSVTIAYLLIHALVDGFVLAIGGFTAGSTPYWQNEIWWPELVNAILLGYIPAAIMIASRGINRDFNQLRPLLPINDSELVNIRDSAITAGRIGQVLKLSGLVVGFMLVFIDPSLSQGAQRSISNPVFIWVLLRMSVFAWLISVLIVSDINATRTYFRIGRKLIKVDLLDVEALSPFARRGLRSALTWVIFSIIFSFFWIGEQASAVNVYLFVIMLVMASCAFAVPLLGVHNNIRSVKRLELERLRSLIRKERVVVLDRLKDENSANPRLANLITYFQLIERTREWPIDAANLLRFFLYLLIGLGSWLGSAIVERLMDRTLGI